MKDIKLSFPYPSTSRHNLSQDVALSLSMGLVTPVRVLEVLPGDSHRIGTSFSLISNPLVKPLLQGINMRYCRFWVPRRIYHLALRANNMNYDPTKAVVRHGDIAAMAAPIKMVDGKVVHGSNFHQSSLFDYLGIANYESNLFTQSGTSGSFQLPSKYTLFGSYTTSINIFNAETYVAYIDICRNYFSDSSTGMAAFYGPSSALDARNYVTVTPLTNLDAYIDRVQNSTTEIRPFNFAVNDGSVDHTFSPFIITNDAGHSVTTPYTGMSADHFATFLFGRSHFGLCVPMLRPDRMSRFFDLKPLTSQQATIAAGEVTIGNLSFLAKMQRYLTRLFFGDSRYTGVMYSIFGQRVPHVDSPVLLDVFDHELGSEMVASTNATTDQNPGVLGGFMSCSGVLSTRRGRARKRYTFNEAGYLIDLVYIMPRLFRASYLPDYLLLSGSPTSTLNTAMAQGNFAPDFNGIGWQQPAPGKAMFNVVFSDDGSGASQGWTASFCSEPSWQQYRTLPDVCHGAFNPLRGSAASTSAVTDLDGSVTINSPLFTFNDRMTPYNVAWSVQVPSSSSETTTARYLLSRWQFPDVDALNSVFGVNTLTTDNIFVVFRYAHQAKRQVSKRFVLTFN